MSITIASSKFAAVVLVGDDHSALADAALQRAAGLLCASGTGTACLRCPSCRKTFDRAHPDVVWVTSAPGKDITVDQVRGMRAGALVRPYEGAAKVYCVLGAERLNASAQNALLKLLEEPPPYAAFLLLTTNLSALLPTVRSRCVIERLPPGGIAVPTAAAADAAAALYAAVLSRDELAVASVAFGWEKLSREALRDVLAAFAGKLRGDVSPCALSGLIGATLAALDGLDANMGVGACCGALAVRISQAIET